MIRPSPWRGLSSLESDTFDLPCVLHQRQLGEVVSPRGESGGGRPAAEKRSNCVVPQCPPQSGSTGQLPRKRESTLGNPSKSVGTIPDSTRGSR